MTQKRLGIIGGAGPLASALLYRLIIEKCYEKKLTRIPEIFIVNYPFTRGLHLHESNQHKCSIFEELQYCLDTLSKAGAERIALSCNTLHAFMNELDLHNMEFLHMPSQVCHKILEQKIDQILVLGTPTTSAKGVYDRPDFHQVIPCESEQQVVNEIIDRVLQGTIDRLDSLKLEQLTRSIREKCFYSGMVLGCTELAVLHHQYPIQCEGIEVFDSINIVADAFVM